MSDETYLKKQLYARRRVLKERRALALNIISKVADRLTPDDKLLVNRGVELHISEKGIYGEIKDTLGSVRARISLGMTEWETLVLDGQEFPDEADATQVYEAFCNALTIKMPTEQLLRSH